MTFDSVETGQFSGQPVRLFLFERQTKAWRFCSASENLEFGGETYLAAQIQRSEIRQTAETAKDKLTITMPYFRDPNASNAPVTQELGDVWFPYIPSSPITVTCMSAHIGESETTVDWVGLVTQPKFTDTQLELICEPTDGHARHRNQGAKWQRACWKTVYSTGIRGCNLVAGPIAVSATLTEVDSNGDVVAAEFENPPRTFVGGTVTREDSSGEYTANIIAHSGDTITLDDASEFDTGDDVIAYTIPIYTAATLTVVDGLSLTAPEFSSAQFNLAGGSLSWVNDDGLTERRMIMSHDGDTITVLYGSDDLAVDLDVIATPGCPRTWAACEARNNTINYGGALYKPTKDPMQESMSWG